MTTFNTIFQCIVIHIQIKRKKKKTNKKIYDKTTIDTSLFLF
jgi:hypothetical protein